MSLSFPHFPYFLYFSSFFVIFPHFPHFRWEKKHFFYCENFFCKVSLLNLVFFPTFYLFLVKKPAIIQYFSFFESQAEDFHKFLCKFHSNILLRFPFTPKWDSWEQKQETNPYYRFNNERKVSLTSYETFYASSCYKRAKFPYERRFLMSENAIKAEQRRRKRTFVSHKYKMIFFILSPSFLV